MDTTNMMTVMKDSISEVFGTMFFQMIQVASNGNTLREWLAQEPSLLIATLDFVGPWSGSFYLLIPAAAADGITANFLGLDTKDLDGSQQEDTIKEALNMIGGGMLTTIDANGSFKLGIPKLIDANDIILDKLEVLQRNLVLFETEDNRLAAGVVMDGLL